MSRRVRRKWRPPLLLVLGGTLLAVLALPILGLTVFRLAGDILGWAETAWLIFWLAVVATAALAWLLSRLVLRPVWALTAHAQAMKVARDVPPPDRFGTAELSDLGQSVIEMGATLHGRARGLSAYADHVTHELKSPLTAIRGAAEMLDDPGLAPGDRARLLQTIHNSGARMQRLLDDLRAHAAVRLTAAQGECTLAEALAAAELPGGLDLKATSQARLPIAAQDLARVITQLARNAAEAGAQAMVISDVDAGLRVADDGPGIAEGDRDRVFDPFFTSRRDAGGSGMGLSVVQSLIEAAGGQITLEPSGAVSTEGASFLIEFT
ncbi:HAMP domain-containing histidine kinase [Aliishimia ponticola]|uniref:histidine kinase n=1 Tax=Aliishimia ponticola TaxID=2499833 RepID=A0A4S4NF39_9RHOB|nr:HAMP domain-containing sensor histidine kinase [Aliishimia ponticola]THH36758.1 HAMP domain-containing histidine kinase [Aliishimia ponticola]